MADLLAFCPHCEGAGHVRASEANSPWVKVYGEFSGDTEVFGERLDTTATELPDDHPDALNATALAADNNDRVVFTCEPDERRLSLSAEVAGDRAVSDELAATFDGDAPPRRWALNRRYALDTLRALECPRVDLRLIDERHPVQIADPDDARSQAVIMPMGV